MLILNGISRPRITITICQRPIAITGRRITCRNNIGIGQRDSGCPSYAYG